MVRFKRNIMFIVIFIITKVEFTTTPQDIKLEAMLLCCSVGAKKTALTIGLLKISGGWLLVKRASLK